MSDQPEEITNDTPQALDATPTPPAAPPETIDALPLWAQKLVKDLRSENAKHRTEKNQAETAKQQAERQAAEEQGKFKELYEAANKELEALRQGIEQERATSKKTKIESAVKLTAAEMKFINPTTALKMADLSAVEINEQGEVTGVQQALEALAKAEPYLIGRNGAPAFSPTNPAGPGNDPVSEIQRKIMEQARGYSASGMFGGAGIINPGD